MHVHAWHEETIADKLRNDYLTYTVSNATGLQTTVENLVLTLRFLGFDTDCDILRDDEGDSVTFRQHRDHSKRTGNDKLYALIPIDKLFALPVDERDPLISKTLEEAGFDKSLRVSERADTESGHIVYEQRVVKY